ncbi:MAG: sulfotransferase [Longimicrobiales bacterium]
MTERKDTPPPPQGVIVLNCYGRGGSGIVWRMIGSSPDVIMTTHEWHVGVFGQARMARKGAVLAFRSLGINSFEPLRRYVFKKTIDMQRPEDVAKKIDARFCVIKLMDYHIVFADMIRRSFRSATFINLTRHPYGQCESLIRSGLSLEHAAHWYADVARMMICRAESGAIAVRFEDIVTQPMQACDKLYEALGVHWAEDRRFDFKIKPYGERRTKDVDVRHGEVIRIGAEDVVRRIDRSVLRGERDRLSDHQRRTIWNLTGEMATHFAYDESGSC